jgi:hypothetical protein
MGHGQRDGHRIGILGNALPHNHFTEARHASGDDARTMTSAP